MNYPLKDAIISYAISGNAFDLLKVLHSLIDHYPKETLDCLMNILGTHDTARILTVLGGIHCQNKDEMASKKAYMNENQREIALKKLKMAAVLQYTLPGVPCLYYGDENATEGHIDPFCRTCFDWENMNEDLIGFYKKLGQIRTEFQHIFKDGAFKELSVEDGFVFYKRKSEDQIYVYVNNSSKKRVLNLPEKYEDQITGEIFENEFIVKPYSYGIFKIKK